MQTLGDLVLSFQDRHGTAISWRDKEERKTITFPELYIQTRNYSRGFLERGLKPEDNVAIFTRNSPQWLPLVLGMNIAGISDVPRELFNTEEAKTIINHSDAKLVIVENEEMLKLARPFFSPEKIFSIDYIEGIRNVKEIYRQGRDSHKDIPNIDPNTRASIIYTSGTTGEPKGVMLSHNNYISNVEATLRRIKLNQEDKFLAMLPQWHVYGRLAILSAAYLGAETFYVTNIKSVLKELQEEHPKMMASVPRVWELVYKNLVEEIRKKGEFIENKLEKSIEADIANTIERNNSFKARANHLFMETTVYHKLRKKLGGKLHHIVSGGSAMPHHLKVFFYNAGLKIAEGYGMTETSPLISGCEQDLDNLFTTGPPLDNVKVKIIDQDTGEEQPEDIEGIIHAKGPNVMSGYYKNQKATDDVLKDGWMNTGDLGYINKGNVVITGRAGENIKLSNGEMINPRSLEATLEESQLIDIAVIIGRGWKGPALLILPNYNEIEAYAKKHKINYSDPKKLLFEPEIKALYQNEVNILNSKVEKPFEKVKDFRLIPELDTGKGLTATKKIKRPEVEKIYKEDIEKLSQKING